MRTMNARVAAATDRLRRHTPFLVTLVLLPQLPLMLLGVLAILVPSAGLLSLLASMVFFLAVPLWNGALLHALGRLSDRGEIDIAEAYRAASAMYYRMLPVLLLSLLAVFGGFLLLILPGIYLGMRLSLAQCVCVFEGAQPVDSLKRSWALTRGTEAELLAYVMVVWGPPLLLDFLGNTMLGPEPAPAPFALLVFVGQLLSIVCGVIFCVLLQELYRDKAQAQRPQSGPREVLMVPVQPGEGK